MRSEIEKKVSFVFQERGSKLKTLADSDAQMYPLNWIKVWWKKINFLLYKKVKGLELRNGVVYFTTKSCESTANLLRTIALLL